MRSAASSRSTDAVAAATDALAAAGCETPRLDAEVLIAAAAGVDRLDLLSDPSLALDGAASRTAMEWIRRRVLREPVAYIIGTKPFRGISLAVDPRVLVPRPETELLVEVAVELAPPGGSVHDVGTGSGAIALAVKHERPDLAVSASDRSPGAVEVARANATRLGLDVAFEAFSGPYDLVVANLPYVRADEWEGLAPEIRLYEPWEALVGGPDGLDEIRALVESVPAGTRLALEHAPHQAESVTGMLSGASTRQDLAGLERVTHGVAV